MDGRSRVVGGVDASRELRVVLVDWCVEEEDMHAGSGARPRVRAGRRATRRRGCEEERRAVQWEVGLVDAVERPRGGGAGEGGRADDDRESQRAKRRYDVGRRRVAECRDERGRGPAASRWDARGRTSGISRGDRAGLTRPRLWRGGATRRTVQRERVGNVWEGGKKFERSSATRVVVVDSTQEIRIRAVGVRERRRVTALAAAARGATAPVGRADGHTPPRRTREPAGF